MRTLCYSPSRKKRGKQACVGERTCQRGRVATCLCNNPFLQKLIQSLSRVQERSNHPFMVFYIQDPNPSHQTPPPHTLALNESHNMNLGDTLQPYNSSRLRREKHLGFRKVHTNPTLVSPPGTLRIVDESQFLFRKTVPPGLSERIDWA